MAWDALIEVRFAVYVCGLLFVYQLGDGGSKIACVSRDVQATCVWQIVFWSYK